MGIRRILNSVFSLYSTFVPLTSLRFPPNFPLAKVELRVNDFYFSEVDHGIEESYLFCPHEVVGSKVFLGDSTLV